MQATHPPHQNACTKTQIADYAQCQGAKVTDKCTQFKTGGASAACGACIETQHDSPPWGVLVFRGSTAFLNVEGCVDVALGTTACGEDLHELYQCEEIVCSGCTGNDFVRASSSSTEDLQGFCKSFSDAVSNPSGDCAAINGDAMPPDVQSCFPDTHITDSQPKRSIGSLGS